MGTQGFSHLASGTQRSKASMEENLAISSKFTLCPHNPTDSNAKTHTKTLWPSAPEYLYWNLIKSKSKSIVSTTITPSLFLHCLYCVNGHHSPSATQARKVGAVLDSSLCSNSNQDLLNIFCVSLFSTPLPLYSSLDSLHL